MKEPDWENIAGKRVKFRRFSAMKPVTVLGYIRDDDHGKLVVAPDPQGSSRSRLITAHFSWFIFLEDEETDEE